MDFREVDHGDEDLRAVLTPRNRLILYMSLYNISVDLDSLLAEWDSWESLVREDMPRLVHDQPRSWWRQMYRSNERLLEAARTGALDDLIPQSPAEEALLALATREGYVGWAMDTARDMGAWETFEALPTDPDADGEYEEILPALAGDADITMLWAPELDGLEDPQDPTNVAMRIGDYRPQVWHRRINAGDE